MTEKLYGQAANMPHLYEGDEKNGIKPITSPDIYRDELSGSSVIMEIEHHKIHEGNHYWLDNDIDMLANGEHYFAFETDGCSPHILFAIDFALLPVRVEAWEAIESYTGGTAIVLQNNNRNSTNTSDITFKHGVTPTIGTGVKYLNRRIGGGTSPSTRTGASSRESGERVLKPNTTYLVKITNLVNAANSVNYSISLYEIHV